MADDGCTSQQQTVTTAVVNLSQSITESGNVTPKKMKTDLPVRIKEDPLEETQKIDVEVSSSSSSSIKCRRLNSQSDSSNECSAKKRRTTSGPKPPAPPLRSADELSPTSTTTLSAGVSSATLSPSLFNSVSSMDEASRWSSMDEAPSGPMDAYGDRAVLQSTGYSSADPPTSPRMNVGVDDFKSLLLKSDIFVDKSLLIEELLADSGHVLLITRPRRWGKTLNMSMLQAFFEIEVDDEGKRKPPDERQNDKLFTGGRPTVDVGLDNTKDLKSLKIADNKNAMKHQGQFPVIFVSLKDVRGSSYKYIKRAIRKQVTNLFRKHRYLKHYVEENENLRDDVLTLKKYFSGKIKTIDLIDSLRFLSELLFKYFHKKVYILIDEYDTPINSSYKKFGEKQELMQVLDLIRGILGSSLKGNPYLERGIITGILRLAKADLFSGLNNVSEYTLLDKKLNKFYGFTQADVDELLRQVPFKTESEKIKDWYNGYNFGGEVIYNPWSIMQCLSNNGKLDDYWVDSGSTSLIDKRLLSVDMQKDLQSLAAGNSIRSSITKRISIADIDGPEGLYSLLLFSGYLNPISTVSEENNIYELLAPNQEVRRIYNNRVLQWVTAQLNIDSSKYDSLVGLLPLGKIDEFKVELQTLLLNATNFHQTGEQRAEVFYNGFMLGIIHNIVALGYIIDSERASGNERPDCVLIPKSSNKNGNAIIIEYKISRPEQDLKRTAEKGLKQIDDQRYDAKVKELGCVKKIIKIGMAFCGNNVELKYRVDELAY